jgi:hypothetical protein
MTTETTTRLHIWFEADGRPWELLSLRANKHGVWRARCALDGRIGWFTWDTVSRARIA